MAEITIAEKLEQIQTQLAALETSYANMTRTYYNMFYNATPMDISLQIYAEDGSLQTITVPNRAKDAQKATFEGSGDPTGKITAPRGSIYLDTNSGNLWYNTNAIGSEGWAKVYSTVNWAEGSEYIAPDGDGHNIQDLNANNITDGILGMKFGGTGVSSLAGILKGIPAYVDENGVEIPGYITTAEAGRDYLDTTNLAGMIVYFPCEQPPAGYLACDGAFYNSETYASLYKVLCDYGSPMETEERDGVIWFRVPNLDGLFIRSKSFTEDNSYDTETGRPVLSIQMDCAPNIKGTWAQEITGAEPNFTGAIAIATDNEGKYIQVDGKTSAPAGAYDYLINFNANNCSPVYSDDAKEIRVRNIALLPAIKY